MIKMNCGWEKIKVFTQIIFRVKNAPELNKMCIQCDRNIFDSALLIQYHRVG